MTLARYRTRVALACLGAALAGCGGGGGDMPAPPPQSAEEQANTSVTAYFDYMRRWIRDGTSDSAEARNVDALQPPRSDVDEAAVI